MKLPRKLKKAKKNFYLTKPFFGNKKFIAKMREFGATLMNDYTFKQNQLRSKPYPRTKWIRKWQNYELALRKKANYEVAIQCEKPINITLDMAVKLLKEFRYDLFIAPFEKQ